MLKIFDLRFFIKAALCDIKLYFQTDQYRFDNPLTGFWHEQMRPDRDNYIDVVLDNVEDDARGNFIKLKDHKFDTSRSDSSTPYDFKSIMHYDGGLFVKPGITGNSINYKGTTTR